MCRRKEGVQTLVQGPNTPDMGSVATQEAVAAGSAARLGPDRAARKAVVTLDTDWVSDSQMALAERGRLDTRRGQ